MKQLNPEQGWEILFCEKCGYAVEKCRVTRNFTYCLICGRRGQQVSLVDRFVVHIPENKVLKPKALAG